MTLAAMLLLAAAAAPDVNEIHRSAILIDTHNDVPMKVVKGYDIAMPSPGGSTDLARLRAGAVDAVFFAAYVPAAQARAGTAAEYCRRVMRAIRDDIVAKHSRDFVLARTADEIVSASRQGKIAALIGIEGGHAIENSLEKLREFFQFGARYMTLTHSNTNDWADSSGDKPRHGGLNALGESVVKEMNRLGMIVDVSHVSDDTFLDVMRVSKAPVIASHSSCRGVTNAKRNMTDGMLRALAKNGGVIQINFACDFINEKVRLENPERKKAVRAKHRENMDALRAEVERKFTRATIADVVAHIDHAVKVAGIDHVGIGSDFDGIDCAPSGLEDNAKFPALTRELVKRGYTREQVHKIYGGNTLRVMRAVERTAGK